MCGRDVNARRQPLKNPIKHRQERQNSRFELLPEVRERCKKSKKIDARAYVNEGSLQGRSRWPKPFQNPSPKHLKFRSPLDFFFVFLLKSAPRASQERPRALHERLKSAPRAPESAQERPKSAPRAPQERPKSAHERCKSAQERPKSHLRVFRGAPERPWGTILRLRSSKEAAFERDPSRDSVEKRVRNDFRSMFASCAQRRTC